MAETIVMPRQGNTVESCVILSWMKNEGDPVDAGDVLCEVETDKSTFEVESAAAGVLLVRYFEEGEDVPVLTPIAVVGRVDENISDLASVGSGAASTTAAVTPGSYASENGGTPPESGAAAETRAAASEASGAGIDGEKIAISPRARRLAERSGVDVRRLAGLGSGPRGRIIERDVAGLLSAGATSEAQVPISSRSSATESFARPKVDADFPGPFVDEPASRVRKIIAERMHASLRDTAQLTLHTSADARAILSYRAKLKHSNVDLGLRSITLNDILLLATSRAVREFPEMNAFYEGNVIKKFEHVHAGFAVDTPRGLMVPVVQYADQLSLRDLSRETNRLADACQDRSITADELYGGTFTVSNLGALGIEMFTPVLNPPQVAILGICSIVQKPVAAETGIELIPHVGLSLTIDHRAVDGSPASWFLKRLVEAIANFDLLLAE